MQKKISIIVPVYNSEKSLRICIDSILSQSYSNFELILINDGSTDGSGDICDSYTNIDERVSVFHKENGGVSSARNIGLRNAKGEWVTFADSDDFVDEKWIETFVNQINNETQIVVQGYNQITEKGCTHIGEDFKGIVAEGLLAIDGYIGYLWCKLFLNQIIKDNKIKFNEDYSFCEDEDFVLRYLSVISNMKSVKEGFYNYNCPDLSVKYSHIDNFDCICSRFDSMKKIYGIAPQNNEMYYYYLRILCNSYFHSNYPQGEITIERTERFLYAIYGLVNKCRLSIITKLAIRVIQKPATLTYIFNIKQKLYYKLHSVS